MGKRQAARNRQRPSAVPKGDAAREEKILLVMDSIFGHIRRQEKGERARLYHEIMQVLVAELLADGLTETTEAAWAEEVTPWTLKIYEAISDYRKNGE